MSDACLVSSGLFCPCLVLRFSSKLPYCLLGLFTSMPLSNKQIILGKQRNITRFHNLSQSSWVFNFFKLWLFILYNLFFQSAPISILEKHELASMTLEYRKECGRDSVLKSLTSVSSSADCTGEDGVRCEHLLQLESGAEIVKGYTEWRPKRTEEGNAGAISGQSA